MKKKSNFLGKNGAMMGIIILIVFLFVLMGALFWIHQPKLYSSAELRDVEIVKDDKYTVLHFSIVPDSLYTPIYVEMKEVQNTIFISFFKQFKWSPIKGILYTPPLNQLLIFPTEGQTKFKTVLPLVRKEEAKVIFRYSDI